MRGTHFTVHPSPTSHGSDGWLRSLDDGDRPEGDLAGDRAAGDLGVDARKKEGRISFLEEEDFLTGVFLADDGDCLAGVLPMMVFTLLCFVGDIERSREFLLGW